MAEFTGRFSTVAEIRTLAESASGASLVPRDQVVTLREARAGNMKVGKGIVEIKTFFINHARAMFAKLGIRTWGPDLDDLTDSLWNEACQISALQVFRSWLIGGAFVKMGVNRAFADEILLLDRTYNHYVHYVMAEKYKKEKKLTGKNQADDKRKAKQRNRQRVSLVIC